MKVSISAGPRVIVGTSAGSFVAARPALGVNQAEHADRIVEHGVPEVPAALLERAAAALPRLLELEAQTEGLAQRERCRRIGHFVLAAATIDEEAHVAAVTSRLPTGTWPAALHVMALDASSGELVRLDAAHGVSVARAVAAARAVPACSPR